jgi:KDO2-lipid IV(A) lauroyltransferase
MPPQRCCRATAEEAGEVTNRAADAAYAAGWMAIKRLPERPAYAIFERIADQVWRRRGPAVTQLERNLGRIVGRDTPEPELRELSRRAMRSYCRYWCDVFRLPVWSRERVIASVTTENEEVFRAGLRTGRGLIVPLPHSANWDLAGAWACLTGAPLTTVAERLRPESLYDRFVAYREGLGMEVLPADGGRSVFTTLQARLRAGGLVCLVADRDLSASGVRVEFFGETAQMPPGPAALAISTGAGLLPAALSYQPDGLLVRFQDEIPVPTEGSNREKIAVMTQRLADAYAKGIAARPEDWHMLQRFWPADLSGARTTGLTVSEAGNPAGSHGLSEPHEGPESVHGLSEPHTGPGPVAGRISPIGDSGGAGGPSTSGLSGNGQVGAGAPHPDAAQPEPGHAQTDVRPKTTG